MNVPAEPLSAALRRWASRWPILHLALRLSVEPPASNE
jgi:hypothetical protein